MKLRADTTESGLQRFWRKRFPYTAVVTSIAFFMYLGLYGFGLVPAELQHQPNSEMKAAANTATATTTTTNPAGSLMPDKEQPTRIVVEDADVDTTVLNPTTENTQVLDNYLKKGAVRYPTSGHPGEGNLFVFGHSSRNSTVYNQAYRTFNGLNDLEIGDTIKVHTKSGVYTYEVATVEFKKNSEAYIPFNTDSATLTLSTCDSFGAKEDRVVVRAAFSDYSPNGS